MAPLTSTLTRETRDDVLDASQGAFTSHAFSFSPQFLGSDVRYVKYFGQFFKYIPLEPAKRERFTNEILRPRFVYAAGVRVGLAPGLGGQELPIERAIFRRREHDLARLRSECRGSDRCGWHPARRRSHVRSSTTRFESRSSGWSTVWCSWISVTSS